MNLLNHQLYNNQHFYNNIKNLENYMMIYQVIKQEQINYVNQQMKKKEKKNKLKRKNDSILFEL